MFIILILIAFSFAILIELVRRYILLIKDPSLEELWEKLDQQEWYVQLVQDPQNKMILEQMKQEGLLRDLHYVQRLIEHEGTREGFLSHIEKKRKPN